ncbi:MAG: TetR/AcrR family transcriptional regulator [Chitinophagaceae bacterium]|nr:TetR/AcrR family transcriptional regulator [Chitinophagaceae bacterium]
MVKKDKDASTQERILLAAKKVFVGKGMAGARMQDIADEAGINKALLHYYFKNKEQLFEKIFQEAATLLFPKLNIIFDSDLPLFEKIEKFAEEYITVMMLNPFLPLFVLNEITRDPNNFVKKIWTGDKPHPQKLMQQIDKEVKKGTIKKISAVQLLMNLTAMIIFPFVARPMYQLTIGINEKEFRAIMEERKTLVPKFIIDSIRK